MANDVAEKWMIKDHGIWESRGPDRSYTSSKVSAWVAIEVWVRVIQEFKLEGEDLPRWIALRQAIFDEVCSQGYDPKRNTFTQYYGSKGLDGSLLAIPLGGFLPADDPRVIGTVEAMKRNSCPRGSSYATTRAKPRTVSREKKGYSCRARSGWRAPIT